MSQPGPSNLSTPVVLVIAALAGAALTLFGPKLLDAAGSAVSGSVDTVSSLGESVKKGIARTDAGDDVVVRPAHLQPFRPDGRTLTECSAVECFSQAFANLAYSQGAGAALDKLHALAQTDPTVGGSCHRLAHAVAAGALARAGGNIAAAFRGQSSGGCQGGFVHGLMQAAFVELPVSELGDAARLACSAPSLRRRSAVTYSCVDGVGHGLLIAMEYNLPAALLACNRAGTPNDRQSCWTGVFSENFAPSYSDASSAWLNAKQPTYPCNVVGREYKQACYFSLAGRLRSLTSDNWGRMAAMCGRGQKAWTNVCVEAVGAHAAAATRYEVGPMVRVCNSTAAHAAACFAGATRAFALNFPKPTRATQLCSRAPMKAQAGCAAEIRWARAARA